MARVLRDLDRVAWVALTAVMVITAVALVGFLFLVAI
jgi:hypothetical protein